MLDRCCFLGWSGTWKSGVYRFFGPSYTSPFYAPSTRRLGHHCAFKKHMNFEVQKLPSQMYFSLPSVIITITSNKPWNTEAYKMDRNPPITNKKPWPFEPTEENFCFLKGPLSWLMTAKNTNVSWLLNFRIRMFLKSAANLIEKMSLGADVLKVEGPIVQKGSIALEVTMATKWAPTTWHRHTERIQWNDNYHNPYLPIYHRPWIAMIHNNHKAK